MMRLLEERVEAISGEFNSHHVSDTLWAYVTMGRDPGERLMGLLEERMETVSGEFDSEDVSDTIRSYVTIGRMPGERLMEHAVGVCDDGEDAGGTVVMVLLEGRSEETSGDFNSQAVL